MAHWYDVFNGVHVMFGVVQRPEHVLTNRSRRANDIAVPLEGAGGKLTSTISEPNPGAWRRERAGKACGAA